MSLSDPKLAYLANHFRVKLELTKNVCSRSEELPKDLIERAVKKLQSVQDSGKIEGFTVFEDRAQKVWNLVRNADDFDPDRVIAFTLAVGVPNLAGLSIERPHKSNAVATLSITATPNEVKRWSFHWIQLKIRQLYGDKGVDVNPSVGQIIGALCRAASGDTIRALEIGPRPTQDGSESTEKPFSLVVNRSRKEMYLMVHNVKAMLTKLTAKSTVELVNRGVDKLRKGSGVNYQALPKDIIAAFTKMQQGPEILGADLPFMLLCAFEAPKKKVEDPGDSPFVLKVSDDKLTATVSFFDLGLYDIKNQEIDREWLATELIRQGIPKEIFKDYISGLVRSAEKREDLTGAVVGKGKPSVSGKSPYLYETYKDDSNEKVDLENDVVDIRGIQKHDQCKEGTLIAEIRYLEPAEKGLDVFGETIEPKPEEEFEVEIGDGIVQRGHSEFYAECDGVPEIEGNRISLSKVYNHVGDVNLRTGDLVFDGPINVFGSVDSGATIEANGNVTVQGDVRGATIKAEGDVVVTGGILTHKGRIEAGGNVTAQFVENSTIHAEGSLVVDKAIIQSTVIVGGHIEVKQVIDGVVAGGYITCKSDLKTAILGFKRGASTTVKVGVDWRIEKKVAVRRLRLEKVEEVQRKDRLEMREIAGMRPAQLTKELAERKDTLLERIRKARRITDQLNIQLEEYDKNLTYNTDSILFAEGTLYENVKLQVGGKDITVGNELAGVAVTAKRRRGGYIIPADDARKIRGEEQKKKTNAWSFGA